MNKVARPDFLQDVGLRPSSPWQNLVINWSQPIDLFADQDTASPELRQDHCPEALWLHIKDTSERMGVAPSGVMLCDIVTCASVISDDWCLQPKRYDYTWTENARLWGLLLGDPGSLKSPILKACTIPIDRLDTAARDRYKDEKRAHKAAHKAWEKADDGSPEPMPPKMSRYLIENTSIEAFTEVLRDDDGGWQISPAKKVLCRQDEMSEFFANMDKYNSTGKTGGDQGSYLRLNNGGRHSLDRVIRGAFSIPNWSACFLGGIQPGPIRKIAKSASEDGMLQRFMYDVPGEQSQGVDRVPNAAALRQFHDLIPALSAMYPSARTDDDDRNSVVVFHDEAHQHREHINTVSRAMAALPDTSARLKSSFAKWPGLFARLCLTFHLINVAAARLAEAELPYLQVIPEKTALMVASYMQDILLPNLLRADAVMFATTQTGHAKWIAGHILARRLEEITTRDVIRAYRDLRAPECRDELNAVMASLVAVSWLEPILSDNPAKPISTWIVNPIVHTAYAAKAERERTRRDEASAQAKENFAAITRLKRSADGETS
jgi:hypothetical protein